ncbi:MAG: hypothetical protein HQK54_17265, partial [Oligoflexales bacterium]|nr:hypothetical protein [Oligoflexales bacterium]
MKTQINEIKRMQELAGINEARVRSTSIPKTLKNGDIIYDRLLDMEHEQLISGMMREAEENPSLTLFD